MFKMRIFRLIFYSILSEAPIAAGQGVRAEGTPPSRFLCSKKNVVTLQAGKKHKKIWPRVILLTT